MKILYTLPGISDLHRNISIVNIPGETWKYINGASEKYMVSNMGRIKSMYDCNGNFREKIRAQGYDKNGYCRLVLYGSGKPQYLKIHTIVANHFCIKKEGDTQVNHINGIKTDNRATNLEWCTLQHNIDHSIKIGLKVSSPGEKNGQAKLTKSQVISIFKDQRKQREIAIDYGVTQGAIQLIKAGKNWASVTKNII